MTDMRTELVPCGGCGEPIERTTNVRFRRSWCERCAPLMQDIYTIERAARLLGQCGQHAAVEAIAAALEQVREQLRTGNGTARELAIAAVRRRRSKYDLLRDLRVLTDLEARADTTELEDELFGDLQPYDPYALCDFARTTIGDEKPEDLLRAARAFMAARPARRHTTTRLPSAPPWTEKDLLGSWPRMDEGDVQ